MGRKKGDVDDSLFKAVRSLIRIANRYREECFSVTVSRETADGFPIQIPGFDTRAMDWPLDMHRLSGSVTDTIEEEHGKKAKDKIHGVLAEDRPTSTLSKKQYELLQKIYCPAYLRLFKSQGLVEELWKVLQDIDECSAS